MIVSLVVHVGSRGNIYFFSLCKKSKSILIFRYNSLDWVRACNGTITPSTESTEWVKWKIFASVEYENMFRIPNSEYWNLNYETKSQHNRAHWVIATATASDSFCIAISISFFTFFFQLYCTIAYFARSSFWGFFFRINASWKAFSNMIHITTFIVNCNKRKAKTNGKISIRNIVEYSSSQLNAVDYYFGNMQMNLPENINI